MDATFLQERIAKIKLRIVEYEDQLSVLATMEGIQQYTLDTGQTRQTVISVDIPKLEKALESLENKLCTYQARLTGNGTVNMRPGW